MSERIETLWEQIGRLRPWELDEFQSRWPNWLDSLGLGSPRKPPDDPKKPPEDPGLGVREPRRPRPSQGGSAAQLEEPTKEN